jgi:hypothetical protein
MGFRLDDSDIWLPAHLWRYPLLAAYLEVLNQPIRHRLGGNPSLRLIMTSPIRGDASVTPHHWRSQQDSNLQPTE